MHVQENDYEELAGDPDHLHAMAQHYLNIAESIRRSQTALHAIRDNQENSDATRALSKEAGEVSDDIEKAQSRYRITAQALLDYVPSLRSAQADAKTAVAKIKEYEGDVTSTGKALDKANDAVKDATDDDKDDATDKQTTAQTAADTAASNLKYWKGKWHDAAHSRDVAADTAKGLINDVVQHHNNGLKNPEHHWYSGAVDFVKGTWHAIKSAGKWVWDHVDEIANVLGVLSMLFGWIPIIGDILIVLTLAVGVLKLIKDATSGKGWKAILGDSVGLVLTAFGGNAMKYLAKAGKFASASKSLKTFAGEAKVLGKGSVPRILRSRAGGAAKAFKETFGVEPYQFSRFENSGITNGAKGLEKVTAPGMKSFLNEVKLPVKFESKSFTGEFQNFIKSGGGLNIGKLSTEAGFAHAGDILKDMPTFNKVALGVMDGRKVLSNVQTSVNWGNDWAHGDWGLSGKHNGQLAITPEKVLINNVLPGGKP
jgi:hypothetical protein